MQFTGRVTQILPKQAVGDKGTEKKSIIVEDDADFPNSMLIDFYAQHIDRLDGLVVGNVIKLDIRHKLYEKGDKRFNNITGGSIEIL
jgi:hypothetical protein